MHHLPQCPTTLLSYSRPPPRLIPYLRASNPPIPYLQQQNRTLFNPASFLSSTIPTTLRHLTHTRQIPYSPPSIFHAIASVDAYPSFLPFVISSRVSSRDANGYPRLATLKTGYPSFGVEEDWESVVHCDPKQGIIEAKSNDSNVNNDSMFEVLQTRWQISENPDPNAQTSVRLDIDVKFRNIVYDQMFAQVEDKVASTMIGAFEKRVQELEGRK